MSNQIIPQPPQNSTTEYVGSRAKIHMRYIAFYDAKACVRSFLRFSHIYQVAGRLYGAGDCYERVPVKKTVTHGGRQFEVHSEVRPTAHFLELLEQIQILIQMRGYKDIAVITHKPVEVFARDYLGLGEADTQHFGNLRGKNNFQHKAVLFILGTPSWGGRAVLNVALSLCPNRIEPFGDIGENGKPKPVYVPKLMEYRLSAYGLALWRKAHGQHCQGAVRWVNGYTDPILDMINEMGRASELMQAIGRARPITNPCDVWLFSSVPTKIALDGLFDDPPIVPGKLNWKLWRKVRAWHNAQPEGTVYGYTELAAGTGSNPEWIASLKALDAIAVFFGDSVERTRSSGNGRPRELIRKNTQN